jgi:hypothetical protein
MNRIQLHVLEWVECGVSRVLVVVVSSPSEGRLLLYHLCDPSLSLPPTFQIRDKRW